MLGRDLYLYLFLFINQIKIIYEVYKKKLAYLASKQAWWDKQPQSFKDATTRPGSVKTR